MSARSDRVRVVLIGAGRFGALHGRVWAEAGAEVVGVCDQARERRDEVAGRLDVTEVSEHAEELIARLRPDAVVIATDESSHASLALLALEARAHVFVEKPLAVTAEDAWAVRAAARAAGRHVVVGHISRFTASHQRILESVRDGRIGRVCALRLRRDFSRGWFESFGSRIHPVWESCIHDVDLAVALTGERVTQVTAVHSEAAGDGASSVVSAQLQFRNGVIATVESAWLIPPSAPDTLCGPLELSGAIIAEVEVLGLEGVLRHRLPNDGLVEWGRSKAALPDLSLWPKVGRWVGGALRHEVEYARDVFAGTREADVVPEEEVCWTVEATEAIERSLRERATVMIEGY